MSPSNLQISRIRQYSKFNPIIVSVHLCFLTEVWSSKFVTTFMTVRFIEYMLIMLPENVNSNKTKLKSLTLKSYVVSQHL